MMDKDLQELLNRAAFLTEAIGRKIRAKKLDLDDLLVLEEALAYVKETLHSVRDTIVDRL